MSTHQYISRPVAIAKHVGLKSKKSLLFTMCDICECVDGILGEGCKLTAHGYGTDESSSADERLYGRARRTGGILDAVFGKAFLPRGWASRVLNGVTIGMRLWAVGPSTVGILVEILRSHPGEDTVVETSPMFPELREELNRRRAEIDKKASEYTSPRFNAFRAVQDLRKELGERICSELPIAVWIPDTRTGARSKADVSKRFDKSVLAEWIEMELVRLGYPLSADHCYEAWLAHKIGLISESGLLIRYAERDKVPILEESLKTAKEIVAGAFRRPPLATVRQPHEKVRLDAVQVTADDLINFNNFDDLGDLATPGSAQHIGEMLRKSGFEALGWYQSYHDWDEDHWGIYLRDDRLVHLAWELRERLREAACPSPNRAYEVIVELVRRHEFFHAQVDFLALRQELVGRRALYRRYSRKVYRKASVTEGALEEALANFAGRRAVSEMAERWKLSGAWNDASVKVALDYVDEILDLGPPGYCHWRRGADPLNWRQFLAQLFTGQVNIAAPLPPIEELLVRAGQILSLGEVPLWLTTRTTLADRLFSTPARREIERFLRKQGYGPRVGGKHPQWSGPGGKKFALPTRDPLSPQVFHSLLDHFGLTKQEYMASRGRL